MAGKIIYGVNAVREALRSGRAVNRVYFAKESRNRDWKALAEQAKAQGVRFDFAPQAKLNELTGTLEHQGVAAAVSPVEYSTLEQCLEACPPEALLLVLDSVQHPKNLGMLIRTAVGAGASGVLLSARGGALLDDAVLRASAGTVFHIPIVPCKNLARALRKLKDAGFWIYGLDAGGEMNVFNTDWPGRCALVLGNESDGMRPGVRKVCDATIGIPLAGGLDSLNVAVAAGIAMFQASALRREG